MQKYGSLGTRFVDGRPRMDSSLTTTSFDLTFTANDRRNYRSSKRIINELPSHCSCLPDTLCLCLWLVSYIWSPCLFMLSLMVLWWCWSLSLIRCSIITYERSLRFTSPCAGQLSGNTRVRLQSIVSWPCPAQTRDDAMMISTILVRWLQRIQVRLLPTFLFSFKNCHLKKRKSLFFKVTHRDAFSISRLIAGMSLCPTKSYNNLITSAAQFN